MIDRVLVGGDASVIRVSLPGFDVKTATLNQLAFSGLGYLLYSYRKGIITGGSFLTLNFGETLTTPPLCFATWQLIYAANPGNNTVPQAPTCRRQEGTSEENFSCQVFTNAVNFRVNIPAPGYTSLVRYHLMALR